jgi:hypothetical protein
MKVQYDDYEHEHEFEPEYGLPEPLPATERVLWQGAPDWRILARRAFHVRTLTVYFALILAIRAGLVVSDGGTASDALRAVTMIAPLAAMAVAVALAMAWLSARTTAYTITDKRVIMRVGIVLNLTFNLPHGRLANAGMRDTGRGTGDIPLTLAGSDQIAYLHLWPHARPWRIAKAEPMLRCVPRAADVAKILADAWSQSQSHPNSTPQPPEQSPATTAAADLHLPAASNRSSGSVMAPAARKWFARAKNSSATQGI